MEERKKGNLKIIVEWKRILKCRMIWRELNMKKKNLGLGNKRKGKSKEILERELGMDRKKKRECRRVDRMIEKVGIGEEGRGMKVIENEKKKKIEREEKRVNEDGGGKWWCLGSRRRIVEEEKYG